MGGTRARTHARTHTHTHTHAHILTHAQEAEDELRLVLHRASPKVHRAFSLQREADLLANRLYEVVQPLRERQRLCKEARRFAFLVDRVAVQTSLQLRRMALVARSVDDDQLQQALLPLQQLVPYRASEDAPRGVEVVELAERGMEEEISAQEAARRRAAGEEEEEEEVLGEDGKPLGLLPANATVLRTTTFNVVVRVDNVPGQRYVKASEVYHHLVAKRDVLDGVHTRQLAFVPGDRVYVKGVEVGPKNARDAVTRGRKPPVAFGRTAPRGPSVADAANRAVEKKREKAGIAAFASMMARGQVPWSLLPRHKWRGWKGHGSAADERALMEAQARKRKAGAVERRRREWAKEKAKTDRLDDAL